MHANIFRQGGSGFFCFGIPFRDGGDLGDKADVPVRGCRVLLGHFNPISGRRDQRPFFCYHK